MENCDADRGRKVTWLGRWHFVCLGIFGLIVHDCAQTTRHPQGLLFRPVTDMFEGILSAQATRWDTVHACLHSWTHPNKQTTIFLHDTPRFSAKCLWFQTTSKGNESFRTETGTSQCTHDTHLCGSLCFEGHLLELRKHSRTCNSTTILREEGHCAKSKLQGCSIWPFLSQLSTLPLGALRKLHEIISHETVHPEMIIVVYCISLARCSPCLLILPCW